MQDLINLSLAEIQRDERARQIARVNANGWKSVQRRSCRERLAKALVALAARLAPPTPMKDEHATAVMRQVVGS
ncbi:MAG: hypothetical protein ACYDAR_15570 [Thermomicrobiales bacterium]